jgi:class 3 adenylate cyclase
MPVSDVAAPDLRAPSTHPLGELPRGAPLLSPDDGRNCARQDKIETRRIDHIYFCALQHEHDAERAVRAGLAIVEAVPKVKTKAGVALQVRVGISTGLVVVGDLIGSGEAQERGVVGETANLAARLQSLAEPGDFGEHT